MNQYEQLLGAITRSQTISEITDVQLLASAAFAQGLISATQLALLRRSATRREDAIVQLAIA